MASKLLEDFESCPIISGEKITSSYDHESFFPLVLWYYFNKLIVISDDYWLFLILTAVKTLICSYTTKNIS
mgnify:CR=1 FL=1